MRFSQGVDVVTYFPREEWNIPVGKLRNSVDSKISCSSRMRAFAKRRRKMKSNRCDVVS